MRIAPKEPTAHKTLILQEVKEGFTYAFRVGPIRSMLLLFALISSMGMSYQVLMPLFAGEVFHGGPDTLGFLMGAVGIGAFEPYILLHMAAEPERLVVVNGNQHSL